ncbi:MAG: gliding motility-associated C-terminal domain-containing protein [Bacteroidetes bacterium]|nr:gliding motility-associated C-terminal domain-containing protein [Bacteroidota bacterium]
MNTGLGLWGTPDYFNACGTNGTMPPSTFAGTCSAHSGGAMTALVLYNVPYPNYREYLATQLSSPMQPGTTYTLSFWLSNGTGVLSPWTIQNIGVCFSASPLSQTGWGVITATPQCEITSNVVSTGWTNYSFTVTPTATWNYLTIGAFRTDANNNPTLSFTNPGGATSSYANYFVDDISVMAPSCTLSVTPSTTSLCGQSGSSATLTANGLTTYSWTPAQSLSSSTGSVVTASPSVTTSYTVTGNTGTCSLISVITISVQAPPAIFITPSSYSLCAGFPATLTANGANSYTWQPGNLIGNPVFISPTTSIVFTLTGQNLSGCSNSTTFSLNVYNPPNLTINPGSNTVCNSAAISFTASGASTYTWLPGLNNTPILTLNPPITSNVYTLMGTNAQGCTSAITKIITAIAAPTISTSSNPTSVCSGGSVTLTATGASNYTWYPGNTGGPSVTINPLSTTIYTAVGETNGCSSTSTVMVSNLLSPTISSSGNITCNNSAVQISIAANSPTYTTSWTGPGIVGSVSGNSITVNAPGIYSVTITDTVTGCSATPTISVANNIGQLPVTIVPSSTLSCFPGSGTQLLAPVPANYTWLPSALVSPNTGALVSVNPSVTTTYSVYAIQGVCSGSAVITISVNPTPTVTISSSNQQICSGIQTTLTAHGALNYHWSPGNITGSLIVVSPLSNTTYTAVGLNGNCQSMDTVRINVLPSPTISASANPSSICAGSTSTIQALGADSLVWSPGISSPFGTTVTVSPLVNTVYTVSGVNSFGCSSSSTVMVSVIPGPGLVAGSSASSICVGGSITLSVSGANTYTWFPTNQTGSTIITSPSVTTLYTVVGQNQSCKSFMTILVPVQNCKKMFFGVTNAAPKPEIYNGDFYKVDFTVTVVNNSPENLVNIELQDNISTTFPYPCTFSLMGLPKINSAISKLQINPFFDGNTNLSLCSPGTSTLMANTCDTIMYSVLLAPNGFYGIAKNSVYGIAHTLNGQILSDSSNNGFQSDPDQDGNPKNNNDLTLIEIDPFELFIPEGFSPNDDGINDLFVIRGLNGRSVNIIVFNRWGNKVYVKENYDNSWDGIANTNSLLFGNGKLPEATYYYILQFTDQSKKSITGFVVLR